MRSVSRLGSVYRCPVCGAEVSVMRRGGASPHPFCCNVAMELTDMVNTVYRCPLCATELMAIKESEGRIEPYCCDNLMDKINNK